MHEQMSFRARRHTKKGRGKVTNAMTANSTRDWEREGAKECVREREREVDNAAHAQCCQTHNRQFFLLFGFFVFKSQLWTVSKCRHLSRSLKIYVMNGRSANSLLPSLSLFLPLSLPLSITLSLLIAFCLQMRCAFLWAANLLIIL